MRTEEAVGRGRPAVEVRDAEGLPEYEPEGVEHGRAESVALEEALLEEETVSEAELEEKEETEPLLDAQTVRLPVLVLVAVREGQGDANKLEVGVALPLCKVLGEGLEVTEGVTVTEAEGVGCGVSLEEMARLLVIVGWVKNVALTVPLGVPESEEV